MTARLFAVLRTAFFGTLFVGLWTWLAVLRSTFGEDYVRYTREVGRWWPRLSPYQP